MRKRLYEFYDRHHFLIVLILSIVIGVSSFLYFYHNGVTTSYGDSKAHLNIARRVTDNITPGFAQLGGVWLPLLHILMLPTVWNDFMWRSGLAGSLVSVPAYIISVYFLYKLVYLITDSKIKAFIAYSIIALNINLLYLQSTPMTESLFVCTLVLSIYFLVAWMKHQYLPYLLASGFAFFLTSINRYEGWIVAICSVIVVGISTYLKKGRKSAEGTVIIFATIALFGIFMWLIWQSAIFHNPLYFLNSEFSAKGQTLIAIEEESVPTYKNPLISLLTAIYAQVHVNGIIVLALAVLSLVVFSLYILIHNEQRRNLYQYLPLYLLLVPFGFLVLALYRGNIPVAVPEFQPNPDTSQYFNIRYALYSLPALAVFAVLIPIKNKLVYLLLFIIACVNTYLLLPLDNKPVATFEDAKVAASKKDDELNDWIKKNYDSGYLIMSAATSDPIMFGTGINMKNFITEGSGRYWNETLVHPGKYARWAVISNSKRDMVNKYIDHDAFSRDFILVKEIGSFKVYKVRNS